MASEDRIAKAIAARLGAPDKTVPWQPARKKGRVVRTGIPALDECKGCPVRIGNLVDVVGANMSGKTQLLHSIAAQAITNNTSRTQPNVCWYDLNGGLDTELLQRLVQKKRVLLNQQPSAGFLRELIVYSPDNTTALCASLHALPSFLNSKDGESIDTIIIDAIGIFLYLDKYNIEEEKHRAGKSFQLGSTELLLAKIMRDILQTGQVTVFVSKCPLYGEQKLAAPWPFPNAGAPLIPKDFMPSLWKSCLSHTLLVYQVQSGEADLVDSGVRALVVLVHKEGSDSKVSISTGASLLISDEGIVHNNQPHFV